MDTKFKEAPKSTLIKTNISMQYLKKINAKIHDEPNAVSKF